MIHDRRHADSTARPINTRRAVTEIAEQEQKQPDDAVIEENVAFPQQHVSIDQAEHDQQCRAPIVQPVGCTTRLAACSVPLQEQQCAGTEQQRKQTAHRAFEEQRHGLAR